MINEILKYAIENSCSDIHLCAGAVPMLRANGDLFAMPHSRALGHQQAQSMIESLMNDEKKQIFIDQLEVDFTLQINDNIRFRVSAFNTISGAAAALRVISDHIPDLHSLHTPTIIRELLNLKHGLILVTGPTGSGKSTTLAAMVEHLNTNKAYNIITIEDPVEFVHSNKKSLIMQREVGSHTLSFSNALRSALRENPDVILVGEMRDLETIQLALSAAETGHLVLATLHTNSADQSISRIIDVFSQQDKASVRTLLASSLRAVISQRLIKTPTGKRRAAFELMLANPSIKNLIREDKIEQIKTIMEINKRNGMITMKDSILELLKEGLISQETADEMILSHK